MDFYYIQDDYINYLRQFDKNVSINKHETRPYVGIVLTVNYMDYFAPLTSPKQKHKKMKNSIDYRKIDGGLLGAINLNNMIPVVKDALIPIIINNVSDKNYKRLLQKQYDEIKKDENQIKNNAKRLRDIIVSNDTKLTDHYIQVKTRCCNLVLL